MLFDWDAEGWQSFVSDPEVPPIMQEAGHKGRPQVAELGGRYDALVRDRSNSWQDQPIKVGVIADQTGPLVVHGHRQRQRRDGWSIDDINAQRRPARPAARAASSRTARPTDSAAAAAATKLVQEDHVDVILGGIYSSTRQAIKGPAVVEGKTLYIYPEQYEGQECDPLIFCTGPVPAQQVEPLIPWLMERDGGEEVLPARRPTTSGRTC